LLHEADCELLDVLVRVSGSYKDTDRSQWENYNRFQAETEKVQPKYWLIYP